MIPGRKSPSSPTHRMGSKPRHNALLASWVTDICGGTGSPNFFCCGMLLLQAVIFSNCVTTEPPRGKREGVPCFWLIKDRPPKRATGSLITPARSSRVLESLRRDVLGKQATSPRIADFLFTCQIQHLLYTNICWSRPFFRSCHFASSSFDFWMTSSIEARQSAILRCSGREGR